jgi:hypothetical protein
MAGLKLLILIRINIIRNIILINNIYYIDNIFYNSFYFNIKKLNLKSQFRNIGSKYPL